LVRGLDPYPPVIPVPDLGEGSRELELRNRKPDPAVYLSNHPGETAPEPANHV
jgi:hypothetical protein